MSHILDAAIYGGGHNCGIGSWPWRRARITPDAPALIGQDGTISSYRQLATRTAQLAEALLSAGLPPGGRVAYLGPNAVSAFETLFATGLAGGVFVPLNTRLAAREIAYMLDDCQASVLVVAPSHHSVVAALSPLPQSLSAVVALQPAECPVPNLDYEAFVAAGRPTGDFPSVTLNDPCLILYTSGTTGTPKGAVLTHGNVTFNTINQLAHFDVRSSDRALCLAPVFHVTGLGQVTLPTLFKGGLVKPIAQFDAGQVLATIENDQITSFSAVPTILQLLCEHPRWPDTDVSSVTTVVYGGSPVIERVAREWMSRGVVLMQGYGMTEAAAGVYMATTDVAPSHPTSIGMPHFFTDVAVLAGDRSTPTATEQSGELLVRGPHMFAGYWNRQQDSASAFTADGWFRTGDVIATDYDGLAAVVDRVKDIIISGGENIYPAEVEAALVQVPGVSSAAVIGVPDDRWGEVGRAFIVSEPPGFDEVRTREFLANHLARYKIPKYFDLIDVIPRNATGKIQRTLLRDTTPPDARSAESTDVTS